MTRPVSSLSSFVPGVARISRSAPLIVLQTSTAMDVETGRLASMRKPWCRAVRYRNASLVAASAWLPASLAKRKSRSVVVTMFSISELACASRRGIEFIKMAGFGIRRPEILNSARTARASMHALRTVLVSTSWLGGNEGRSLYGRSGSNGIQIGLVLICTSRESVDLSDRSGKCVDETALYRQINRGAIRTYNIASHQ